MKILEWSTARKTYPTGNPNFSVMQAFPAAVSAEDADPFLMCDFFGPSKSKGKLADPDAFEVPWHPHRGMDILTYLQEGVGRHADSLGNREEYATPGMQWISVGSGIEHAEGGGTPAGEIMQGFQIWVNVPARYKMDDPQYGTEPPERLPYLDLSEGVGPYNDAKGPFATKQAVQILDYQLQPRASHTHRLCAGHDNIIIFVYKGSGQVSGQALPLFATARLDTTGDSKETLLQAGDEGMHVMVFSGKRINEPIAWRGPIVMNTQQQLMQTFRELESGRFPPVRASWDYKRIATKPKPQDL
eukprot:gene34152-41340_t